MTVFVFMTVFVYMLILDMLEASMMLICLRNSQLHRTWSHRFTRKEAAAGVYFEYLLGDPGSLGVDMYIRRRVEEISNITPNRQKKFGIMFTAGAILTNLSKTPRLQYCRSGIARRK
uniref:Uncharacterized protein n=1 Tax=Spongospora subterranea TaxID=70186 RepID=A0A0H5RDJ6_9EUKA|eukprot:CRZ12088.1 hypothetical protein [Spongospora subterranea]